MAGQRVNAGQLGIDGAGAGTSSPSPFGADLGVHGLGGGAGAGGAGAGNGGGGLGGGAPGGHASLSFDMKVLVQ